MKNIKAVYFNKRGARMFFIEFMKANRGAINDNPLVQTVRAFKLFLKNNCGWDEADIKREERDIVILYHDYLKFYREWMSFQKYSLSVESIIEFFGEFIKADSRTFKKIQSLQKIQSEEAAQNIILERIIELIEIAIGTQVVPLPAIAYN